MYDLVNSCVPGIPADIWTGLHDHRQVRKRWPSGPLGSSSQNSIFIQPTFHAELMYPVAALRSADRENSDTNMPQLEFNKYCDRGYDGNI